MPIDDPFSSLEILDLSDERQRSPLARLRQPLADIIKFFSPLGMGLAIDLLAAADRYLNGSAESNIRGLLGTFAGEMKYAQANIAKILAENESQRRFIEEELPGLALDALRRAEQCRARERVARLARILAHAAAAGAADGADAIEDMLAIATRLSDLDVLVLDHAIREYQTESRAHPREAPRSVAARAWRCVPAKGNRSMSDDQLVTVGLKLESFGLAARVQTDVSWEAPVFRPLEAGSKFIEYIQSAAAKP